MSHCDGHFHDLVDISWSRSDIGLNIVRWCETCGAIVVDKEVDGRLYPGNIQAMMFPKNLTRKKI